MTRPDSLSRTEKVETPNQNAALIAELQAFALACRMFGLDGLRAMQAEPSPTPTETEGDR